MKKIGCLFVSLILISVNSGGQDKMGVRVGMTSEQNLQALTDPSLYSTISGFDDRYQGVRGSPRMLDTLLPSTVKLKDRKSVV